MRLVLSISTPPPLLHAVTPRRPVLSQSSIFGQNPKIGCQEFNDLQTPKLSKKQLCDRTRIIPCAHDFRLEHHPPGAGPRRPSVAKTLIETTTRRGPLPISRCQARPLVIQL